MRRAALASGVRGVFSGSGGINITASGITAYATGSVNLPLKDLPQPFFWVGNDLTIASASMYVNYQWAGAANNYFDIWGTIPLTSIGKSFGVALPVGVRVGFDGSVSWLYSNQLPLIPSAGDALSPDIAHFDSSSATGTFAVPAGTPWILLGAAWTNTDSNAPVEITSPSGVLYTETNFGASTGIALIDQMTGSTQATVDVLNPAAGDWSITVPTTAGLGSVSFNGSGGLITSGFHLAFVQAPSVATAGAAFASAPIVAIEDPSGNVIASDASAVTLTLNGGVFSTGASTATVTAVDGVATFSNLAINSAGNYTLTADDGSFSPATSAVFTVGPAPTPTPTPTPIPTPTPTPTPGFLLPVADAYVRDGTYATENFGTSTLLMVKDAVSGDGYVRNTYLTFDLQGMPTITSAVLELYGDETAGSPETSITLAAYPVANTSWSQSTVTFDNAPAVGSPAINTVVITGTTPQMYSLDLTSYLQQQQTSGNMLVTIALEGVQFTDGGTQFNGTLAATNQPALVITGTSAPAVTSLSPSSGPATGGTSVVITGTGFTGATAVRFGGLPATNVVVNAAGTQITAIDPEISNAGTVDVQVTTPGGTSTTSTADQFTYVVPLPAGLSASPGAVYTFNSTSNTLSLTSGALTFNGVGTPSSLTLNVAADGPGSNLVFDTTTYLNSLTLTDGAKAQLVQSGTDTVTGSGSSAVLVSYGTTLTQANTKVLVLNSLSIPVAGATLSGGATNSAQGTLDLTNNAMILNYAPGTGTTALAAADVLTGDGSDGAVWDGTGITSSNAEADNNDNGYTAIGVGDNGSEAYNTFAGQNVSSGTQILFMYTYYGDSDLNGILNVTDTISYESGLKTHPGGPAGTGWEYGSLDYGATPQGSLSDLQLLEAGFRGYKANGAINISEG